MWRSHGGDCSISAFHDILASCVFADSPSFRKCWCKRGQAMKCLKWQSKEDPQYPPYVLMFLTLPTSNSRERTSPGSKGADYEVTSDQLQPSSKAQEMETGSRNSSEVTGHRSICTRGPAPCVCVRNAHKMNSNRQCFLLPMLTTSSLLFLFWTKNRV